MVQRRGRPLRGFGGDSSSSDDDGEDAFASISRKKKPRTASVGGGGDKAGEGPAPSSSSGAGAGDRGGDVKDAGSNGDGNPPPAGPAEGSSSAKRHHHVSAARQAKMDALLQELQTAKPTDAPRGGSGGAGGYEDHGPIHEEDYYGRGGGGGFAPRKMGSYVEPGMEHLTTNLFVGNLDPMTTEEELTDAFRQFGDLYSVKIMWPRTAEERARNRNTGFVCFMRRRDAEDAIDEFCDADPLGTGRRMVLRWGKNVKKTVKFGTGGVPTNLRKRPRDKDRDGDDRGESPSEEVPSRPEPDPAAGAVPERKVTSQEGEPSVTSAEPDPVAATDLSGQPKARPTGPTYDPAQHSADAIVVTAPSDPHRMRFITTVASFVSKDGSVMEQKLIETQAFNPDFQFLTAPAEYDADMDSDAAERLAEHIFYRWRVYAFAQGDGPNSWRTEPFVMFVPHGRFWIPPPPDNRAAREEEETERRRERGRREAQEERRKAAERAKGECATTGAQMKRAEGGERGGRSGMRLNDWESKVFRELLQEKLCASRGAICEAMAFAFDKSGAAREISELLREAMLESAGGISVDTRIARLFLLSDILFNSQQPGVRNAFQYRDAIEAMSPDVFESLGRHGGGRMTKNKLRKAVSSVLSAWTNWSVYNSAFIDELESKFEGRDVTAAAKLNKVNQEQKVQDKGATEVVGTVSAGDVEDKATASNQDAAAVSTTPRGTWTSATSIDAHESEPDIDGEDIDDLDGEAMDDLDGEALDDLDGEALDDIDGDALDESDQGSMH